MAEIGIMVAWITGSKAGAVTHRARSLGVAHVVLGAEDKLTAWERLRSDAGVQPAECAHVGDDLPDIPVMVRCGLAVTVPHAPGEVHAAAHWVTSRAGGAGAVRDFCDLLLASRDAPPDYVISGA